MHRIYSLLIFCLLTASLLGEYGAVNLSCDSRLKECEKEVRSLLKRNGECSSDLDALRVEVSHLSDMVTQFERNQNLHAGTHRVISWNMVFDQLKSFLLFFKGFISLAYSHLPPEVDSQLRQAYSTVSTYFAPIIIKYTEVQPLIYRQINVILNKYVGMTKPYVEYFYVCSNIINDNLDIYVNKIESVEPRLVGSIPKTLYDRVLFVICAFLALYLTLELACIILKFLPKCCGLRRHSCNTNKKGTRSPSSKSTPSNKRK
ncbi:hypothetical protein HWI79_2540 [Cryptosporidium felis]|nr:hypothetical protein HWI79_2540 [Cryptosporidium felis]